jgi:hypothetical protein
LELFITNPVEMPSKRHYRALSDLLHILKRAPELSLCRLVRLLGDDLPAVVFSDDPVIKMHDSLLMVPFRFEILVKLYNAGEMA